MLNLIGTYECKADTKGRMMVPAPLKKQLLPLLEDGFVLKRSVFEPCLELYPMEEWNQLMQKMRVRLNTFNKTHNDFIRKFTAGVKLVDVDANGRLLLPKDLLVFSGIEKEIVLNAAINIIEVWDKSRYEHAVNEVDNIAALAEEVMGGVYGEELS